MAVTDKTPTIQIVPPVPEAILEEAETVEATSAVEDSNVLDVEPEGDPVQAQLRRQWPTWNLETR